MAMAERAGDSCRHMTAEQLVDLVLSSAHPRLQQRCSRDQIVNLLQEKHAAYDAHGVHSLLARKYDAVEEQLEAANAAPSTFVSSLWLMVQPALSTAAEEDEPMPPQRSLQTLALPASHRQSRVSANRFLWAASLAKAA